MARRKRHSKKASKTGRVHVRGYSVKAHTRRRGRRHGK